MFVRSVPGLVSGDGGGFVWLGEHFVRQYFYYLLGKYRVIYKNQLDDPFIISSIIVNELRVSNIVL